MADFFEKCVEFYNEPKKISNWMMGDLLRRLYEENVEIGESKITPKHLTDMITLIDEDIISGKIAKSVLPKIIKTGKDPAKIVREEKFFLISSEEELEKLTERVFRENRKAVRDALSDEKAVHYLVGQLMDLTKGRADPQLANKVVREKLKKAS